MVRLQNSQSECHARRGRGTSYLGEIQLLSGLAGGGEQHGAMVEGMHVLIRIKELAFTR